MSYFASFMGAEGLELTRKGRPKKKSEKQQKLRPKPFDGHIYGKQQMQETLAMVGKIDISKYV